LVELLVKNAAVDKLWNSISQLLFFVMTPWLFPLMNIILFADMILHSDRFIHENFMKPVTW